MEFKNKESALVLESLFCLSYQEKLFAVLFIAKRLFHYRNWKINKRDISQKLITPELLLISVVLAYISMNISFI